MCHSDASRPPAAHGAVPAAGEQTLTLTSADGTTVLAYAAHPAVHRDGVGIVVMPDVRGLHDYYRQLAVRFAEIGAEAVAIDYFGRTAPDGDRSEAFEFWPHVEQTTPQGVARDVSAAVEHLLARGATSVFTVGFCFGGGYSWRQSADTAGLAGAIGFYGRPSTAAEVVDRMQAPLLLLVAGADQSIPVADTRALADAAPVTARVVVFADAPHSFFDRSYAEHEQECARAWVAIQEFLAAQALRVA